MGFYMPDELKSIIQKLNEHNFKAYIVGGCIRDFLLGITPEDFDICTSALPEQVIDCFSKDFSVVPTGLKHGTVTIVTKNSSYEVTTFRTDEDYENHRKPKKVRFGISLNDDLSRRDFTCNAMAYHPKTGLIDPFGGKKDLEKGILKCVGEPKKRFEEDALRILRAIRFFSKYNLKLNESAEKEIHKQKSLLKHISAERIHCELDQIICGKNALNALFDYSDVLLQFIPELKPCIGFNQHNSHHIYSVWDHVIHSISYASKDKVIRLTMLFHDIGKPSTFSMDKNGVGHFYNHAAKSTEMTSKILKRLKYDNKTIKTVCILISHHSDSLPKTDKQLLNKLNQIGEDNFRLLLKVKEADAKSKSPDVIKEELNKIKKVEENLESILSNKICFSIKDLAINGSDLIKLGIQNGPQIGSILEDLLSKVMDNELKNENNTLINAAKKIANKEKNE